MELNFYSRASCEARRARQSAALAAEIISTHAPRVRRDFPVRFKVSVTSISTHAPRVRRDSKLKKTLSVGTISTHAPRVRRDKISKRYICCDDISTHAPRVRRDELESGRFRNGNDFYSRASCEARLKRT